MTWLICLPQRHHLFWPSDINKYATQKIVRLQSRNFKKKTFKIIYVFRCILLKDLLTKISFFKSSFICTKAFTGMSSLPFNKMYSHWKFTILKSVVKCQITISFNYEIIIQLMSITVMLMTRQTFWTSVAGKSRATKTSGNRGASVTGSVIMTRYSNTGTLTCGIFYFYCGNARKIQFWWYLFAKWLVHVVVNNVHSSKSQFF